MEYRTRQGVFEDAEWLYELYRSTMRTYVEQTWEWDEEFQRKGFLSNLSPTLFRVVVVSGEDVGAYLVSDERDYYWLETLLINEHMQRNGLGAAIVIEILMETGRIEKPLKLSVLKVNPAREFYARLGFSDYDQDDSSFKMMSHTINKIHFTKSAQRT